jgi:hypothetical protein
METGALLNMVRGGEENTKISELGNQYTNNYIVYYQVIDGLSFPCSHCNSIQKYIHTPKKRIDTYIWCQNCYESEKNNALDELEIYCEVYDFIITYSFIDDYIEKYKIKINDYYGILRITANMETNSWSRNPTDIYVSTYYIFSNENERDKYYESV